MSYFLIPFLLLFSIQVYAGCEDNKNIVIFINTNTTIYEVDAARKGACARGDRLVVLPQNYPQIAKVSKKLRKLKRQNTKCFFNNQPKNCKKYRRTVATLNTKMLSYRKQVNLKRDFESVLERADKSGAKVKSLILSGHNGGGAFSGSTSSITRGAIKTIFEKHRDQANSISSLLLLGCYTGTHGEMLDWKGVLPNAKLVAGYEDSAPKDDKLAGHTYIEDILKNEAMILNAGESEALQKILAKQVRYIKYINAAVYVDTSNSCHPNGLEYFYRPRSKHERFMQFDPKECKHAREQLPQILEIQDKYLKGKQKIPKNTSRSELRDLYTYSRQYEYCFRDEETDEYDGEFNSDFNMVHERGNDEAIDPLFMRGGLMNPENQLMLLFHKDSIQNFSHYFDAEFKRLESDISNIDLDDVLESHRRTYEATLANNIEAIQLGLLYEKSPKKYKKFLHQKVLNYKKIMETMLARNGNLAQYVNAGSGTSDESMFGQFGPWSPNIPLNIKDEVELYNQYSFLAKGTIRKIETDAEAESSYYNAKLIANYSKEVLEELRESYDETKEIFPKFKEKFWSPTIKNTKGKTRKEILENAHLLKGVVSVMPLSKHLDSFSESSERIERFMVNLSCMPFDWHEYNGKAPTERPECLDKSNKKNSDTLSRMVFDDIPFNNTSSNIPKALKAYHEEMMGESRKKLDELVDRDAIIKRYKLND